MDRLKEKPGLVALGVAAAATAGLLLYKAFTVKAQPAEAADSDIPAGTQEQELENNFFLDPKAPQSESEKLIVKWVSDQLDSLKGQQDDNKILVVNRRLQKEDFLRLMMIIEGRTNVQSAELDGKLATDRLSLL